ncbi:flippase [Candidatus Micrarchaeota archaeon]|nr:flippase [Candidatus Micrarchaeota archaeon]
MGYVDDVPDASKEVAKGSVWNIAGNLLFSLISFLYVLVVAWAVSPDDLGLYYLALSAVSLFAVIGDLGLGNSLGRYIPFYEGRNERGKIPLLLKSGAAAVTASAVILMIVLWVSADLIGSAYDDSRLANLIRLLAVHILLANWNKISSSFLQARRDMRGQQISQNAGNLAKLVFTSALIGMLGPTPAALIIGFILSVLVSTLASSFLSLGKLRDYPPSRGWFAPREFLREIVAFGIALGMLQSFNLAISSVTRLMIGYLSASDATLAVATFSIAVSLSSVTLIFSSAIGSIFLPLMAKLYGNDDRGKMRDVTGTSQRWAFFLTIPLAIAIAVYSEEVLGTFYGSSYAWGGAALSIICIAMAIRSISAMLSLSLASMRAIRLTFMTSLVSGLINLALNLLLIPHYGIMGAAIAMAASAIAIVAMNSHYAGKLMGYAYPPSFIRLVLCAIMALAVMALSKSVFNPFALAFPGTIAESQYAAKALSLAFLALGALASGAIFALLALALKCFGREDVSLLQKGMNKMRLPEPLVGAVISIARCGIG